MDGEISKCLICNTPINKPSLPDDIFYFDCHRCGRYGLTKEVYYTNDLKSLNAVQRANLSGWIREYQREVINTENLKRLQSISTPTVHEKALKLLKYFSNQFPEG